MSEDEPFLARWSRRKRTAADEPAAPAEPPAAQDAPAAPEADAPVGAKPTPVLPPIDSITADSTVGAFLAAGVPVELTRAALRRAWSADPAIRDFIGLSENSWDFNAPDGVPGFGSIKAEEVERLLQLLSRSPDEEEPAPDGAASLPGGPQPTPVEAAPVVDRAELAHRVNAAVQHDAGEEPIPAPPARRRHGGALPD